MCGSSHVSNLKADVHFPQTDQFTHTILVHMNCTGEKNLISKGQISDIDT